MDWLVVRDWLVSLGIVAALINFAREAWLERRNQRSREAQAELAETQTQSERLAYLTSLLDNYERRIRGLQDDVRLRDEMLLERDRRILHLEEQARQMRRVLDRLEAQIRELHQLPTLPHLEAEVKEQSP